jgi:hypothetical protein
MPEICDGDEESDGKCYDARQLGECLKNDVRGFTSCI